MGRHQLVQDTPCRSTRRAAAEEANARLTAMTRPPAKGSRSVTQLVVPPNVVSNNDFDGPSDDKVATIGGCEGEALRVSTRDSMLLFIRIE